MEPELRPCLRELAIELYSNAILQAAELGAESVPASRDSSRDAICSSYLLMCSGEVISIEIGFSHGAARCRQLRTDISSKSIL